MTVQHHSDILHTRRIFYPFTRRILVLVALVEIGIVAGLFWIIWWAAQRAEKVWNFPPLLAVGLPLVMAALLFYQARTTFLITSPSGIEFHSPTYSICTTWDNLARFEAQQLGFWYGDSIILHKPVFKQLGWWARPIGIREPGRTIPLMIFQAKPGTELRRTLEAYAPHLFA